MPTTQGKVHVVRVEVQDVEALGFAEHLLELEDLRRQHVHTARVESQRARAARDEAGRRDGITAREQCDLVPLPHELFGQPVDDALRTSVQARRNAFNERRDLRDAQAHIHDAYPPGLRRERSVRRERPEGRSAFAHPSVPRHGNGHRWRVFLRTVDDIVRLRVLEPLAYTAPLRFSIDSLTHPEETACPASTAWTSTTSRPCSPKKSARSAITFVTGWRTATSRSSRRLTKTPAFRCR